MEERVYQSLPVLSSYRHLVLLGNHNHIQVGGSVREHVIIPAYANSGALGNAPVNGSGALSTSSALTVGVNVRQVACGEAHTLFLTFQGEVLASGSNFFGQLGDGSTVDHYSVGAWAHERKWSPV
jgi:alpha-tubulin suppressor-like RCC1 family protein